MEEGYPHRQPSNLFSRQPVMSHRASATFTVTSWDAVPYDEPDGAPQLSCASVRKVFSGDLEGDSTAEVLMCMADPARYQDGAGYLASERFTGRVGERTGTFVIQHGGLSGPGVDERTFGNVVPGSGTGDLAGLAGTVEIGRDADGKHTLALAYDFF
jgi:hypothetical protein